MRINELLNYKEICEEMNDIVKSGGKYRNLQLRNWQQEYDIEKINKKYIIKGKLTEAELKNNISKKLNNSNRLKFFDLYDGKYEDKDRSVIYKIILDDKIYIGQTENLYKRLKCHYYSNNSQGGKLLRKGGKMYIIKFTEDLDKKEINKIENSLIKSYENDENWFCVNKCGYPRFKYGRERKFYNIKVHKEDLEEITYFMNQNNILYDIK